MFWRLPRGTAGSRLLVEMWCRGTPALSSIIAVLAVNRYPGPREEWAGWQDIPQQHLGDLAGLDRSTVARALRAGADLGMVGATKVPWSAVRPWGGKHYRLSKGVFAPHRARFAPIPLPLIEGGTWAGVPTSAARHFYLYVAATAAVLDEGAYRSALAGDMHAIEAGEAEDCPLNTAVRRAREAGARFERECSRGTGLSPDAVGAAVKALRDGDRRLIVSRYVGGAGRAWYAPTPLAAWDWVNPLGMVRPAWPWE